MGWFQTPRAAAPSVFAVPGDVVASAPPETLQVEAEVMSVFPEHRQARLLDDEGFEYALTSSTPGVDVRTLEQGQRLQCTVEADLRRVLHAEVLA